MTYKDFFKGKKVAIVGLGRHMEMVADIKFLLKLNSKASGPDAVNMSITLYDMRSENLLKHALAELIEAGLTQYTVGQDEKIMQTVADSLAGMDLVILSPEISMDSSYLTKAHVAKVPIEFPQTLLLKLIPPVTVIGVLGACGKSTVAQMIFSILKKAFSDVGIGEGRARVYHIDPDAPSALTILKTIKKDDIVVSRIPVAMVSAYNNARISPHVAVFTTFAAWRPKQMATTVSTILEFQTYNNFIIGNDTIIDQIREDAGIKPKAKMLRTHASSVPAEWPVKYRGAYDHENAALALQVAELFKVSPETVRQALTSWTGLEGRLAPVKKVAGIEFYNDTCAVSPTATLAALRTISQNKNITLILGGAATDDVYDELIDNISQYVSSVILLPGSGTINIRKDIAMIKDLRCTSAHSIEEAVKIAREHAGKGEAVLFSPAFEACGVDTSRRTRGDRFVKAVRAL